MAQDIVSGLFGLSPYETQMQQQQMLDKQAMQFSAMDPLQIPAYLAGRAGQAFGGMLAESQGMVNPALAQAQQRYAQLQGLDPSSSQSLLAKAQQVSDPKLKMQLTMLARQREAEEADRKYKMAQAAKLEAEARREATPFAKIDPKDYTQESVRKYMETRNPADLVAVTEKGKVSTWEMELVGAGFTPGTPAFQEQMRKRWDAEVTGRAKGGGTTLVMPGQKEFKDIPAFRKSAQETVKPQLETLYAADKALSALDLAMKNSNAPAFQVARTQLAKTAGDSQISLREIESAGGDPSLYGRLIDTTSTLFTGTPSLQTQKDMERTLKAIQIVARQKGKAEIDVQRKIAKQSGFTDDQIDTALKFDAFNESNIPVGKTIKLQSGKTVTRIN